jgi:hypothetical protein
MRSAEEVLKRIKIESEEDVFGMAIHDLIGVLTFDEAESIRKEDVSREDWGEVLSRDVDEIKKRLLDYLPFAIEKCVGHRGISASRSISHMRNFVWLMGDEEALAFVEEESNYPNYGAPILRYLCKRYGFEYSSGLCEMDLKAFERMAEGLSCEEGCSLGCEE